MKTTLFLLIAVVGLVAQVGCLHSPKISAVHSNSSVNNSMNNLTSDQESSAHHTGPTSTSITFFSFNPHNGVASKLHDDDGKETFTDRVDGTQSIFQWRNACCIGDFIFNLDFNGGPRKFFIDLNSPASPTSKGFGVFNHLSNLHLKIKGIGAMIKGKTITNQLVYFASDLDTTTDYKLRFDAQFSPAVFAKVEHPSKNKWIIQTDPQIGDTAVLGSLDKENNLTPLNYYHLPFYAEIAELEKNPHSSLGD